MLQASYWLGITVLDHPETDPPVASGGWVNCHPTSMDTFTWEIMQTTPAENHWGLRARILGKPICDLLILFSNHARIRKFT